MSIAPGLPGAAGHSRSVNAATVAASSSLKKAPWPSAGPIGWAASGTLWVV